MAKKKLLIAAVFVGAFAMMLMVLYGKQIERQTEEITANPHEVVVAAYNIPAGTPLSRDMLKTRTVPGQFLPANPLLARDIDIYLGQAVAQDIEADAMIMTSDFATMELARTLAGRIPTGERAMTIPVDAITGIAGLLRPGDRVDILGTFPVHGEDDLIPEAGSDAVGYVTLSLLQNVTLLAVGQEISEVGARDASSRGMYSNVTLSLTPNEAELIVISQTRGNLQLLLRHREDLDSVEVQRTTLRSVLEGLEVIQQRREERVEERRVRRPAACEEGFIRRDGECVPNIIIYR